MPDYVIDEKYLGSVCKIRTMENALLSTGHLIEITDKYATISNEPELPTIIHYNKKVKLTLLNDKLGYKTLIATVYTSTTKVLKLFDINEVTDFEKRSFFRLNVNLKGIIELPSEKANTESAEDETSEDEAHEVDIENVSLSGILFTSVYPLKMNDRLTVTLLTPYGKLKFDSTVRRIVKDHDGSILRYGCEFDKYPDKVGDALWKYMMLKERDDIRRAKGEWSSRG